ncbi:MAG: YitT family protein [Bacteroidales bacterium]|nr:YitT family protein [Candidatus Cacconaster merdequi]
MTVTKVLSVVKSYGIITFGLLLYCLAWTIFIIPNRMVGGGVTGACAILEYCTGFPVSYSFIIINVVLLIIAMKLLGGGFGAKTIYAMFVTALFLGVLPKIISPDFIREMTQENGRLLCAILGGAMSGVGVALTFMQGGSSGGTDIIALIVSKYRAVAPGRVILLCDIVIIASSLIVPTDGPFATRIATVIYGYMTSIMFSATIDVINSASKQSVQVFIFSKKYEELADKICKDLHRGTTVLNGTGWFTKQNVNVLMVIARKHDTNSLLSLVKMVDPNAFVTVGSVMGVYGQGFDEIKQKKVKKQIAQQQA